MGEKRARFCDVVGSGQRPLQRSKERCGRMAEMLRRFLIVMGEA
jgi:hypothetical protein